MVSLLGIGHEEGSVLVFVLATNLLAGLGCAQHLLGLHKIWHFRGLKVWCRCGVGQTQPVMSKAKLAGALGVADLLGADLRTPLPKKQAAGYASPELPPSPVRAPELELKEGVKSPKSRRAKVKSEAKEAEAKEAKEAKPEEARVFFFPPVFFLPTNMVQNQHKHIFFGGQAWGGLWEGCGFEG